MLNMGVVSIAKVLLSLQRLFFCSNKFKNYIVNIRRMIKYFSTSFTWIKRLYSFYLLQKRMMSKIGKEILIRYIDGGSKYRKYVSKNL